MLDRRFIRSNPDAVKQAVRDKGLDLDVDELLDVDQRVRKLTSELDNAQAERKSSSKEFAKADETRRAELRAQAQELDGRLSQLREELGEASAPLQQLLLRPPTIPWKGAPVGDESANVVTRSWGSEPEFDFTPLDHGELLEKRDWPGSARAARRAGGG